MVKLKYPKINFTKEVFFMYFNIQEEIITRIGKSLEKSLILRKKVIKILSGIIIGIILRKSTIVSRIADKYSLCIYHNNRK